MKCPKCHYLGFETGDRCRNCGYDFSLLADPSGDHDSDGPSISTAALHAMPPAPDFDRLSLGPPDIADQLADVPLHQLRDERPGVPDMPAMRARLRAETGRATELPLFTGGSLEDEPLVRLPPVPRAPLAVRKTPEIPRLRTSTLSRPRPDGTAGEPFLNLAAGTTPPPAASRGATRSVEGSAAASLIPCTPGARLSAALLDLALLFGVDLIVIYFTLRMSALTMGEWSLLPPAPLLIFLALLKVAYYFSFTAIGGQTIGKMATRIRVISEDGPEVAPAFAFRRTLAAAASIITLGGTFLPAIIGSERRAVHDRLARTRVVALPAA